MTWRERLEMKAGDFARQRQVSTPVWLSDAGCELAANYANTHLTGLAEVLELVEWAMYESYCSDDEYSTVMAKEKLKDALTALRKWKG